MPAVGMVVLARHAVAIARTVLPIQSALCCGAGRSRAAHSGHFG